MNCVFRVDASIAIGTGHVMRCLTLADVLRERGAECRFICREHPGNLLKFIRQQGFEAIPLPISKDQPPAEHEVQPLTHASWLGCDWVTDAAQAKVGAGKTVVDWLIVDHYALDARWELALAGNYCKLMVIDDLADRPHHCDLLLDQNWFGDQTLSRYQDLVPAGCQPYLGPEYSLLKPEYAQLRAALPQRDGTVHRVLVFLGGSDPSNQTAKVLVALSQPGLEHLKVDVVLGQNHPDARGIATLAATRPGTTLHQGLPTLAPLMGQADLMISAGGSTTWERMCLGLPAIVISVADNQTTTNLALMQAGYIDFLGEMNTVTANTIAEAVRRYLDNPSLLKAQSGLGRQLVTGDGAKIISQQILTLSQAQYAA